MNIIKNLNLTMAQPLRTRRAKIECLSPIILILLLNLIASFNIESCIIIFLLLPVALSSIYIYCAKKCGRTNFFFAFGISSGCYLLILFEFFVPLLELLPQENFIFILLISLALFFFIRTNQKASMNRLGFNEPLKQPDEDHVTLLVADDKSTESDEEVDSGETNFCQTCHKSVPARTFHCNFCKCCIIGRDHHNYFLNCCIGRFNHKLFLAGCVACVCALVLFANLSLTSICHPFPIFAIFGVNVLLPDDCSDVFNETEYALCFVGAIFALELSVALILVIIQQSLLISKGLTSTEYCLKGECGSRYGCLRNWRNFCI